VLGTSAEGADGGEVGRGNRVNGLISFSRPMTLEAAAGKNPVSHVGKIYNLLSHHLARRIHAEVEGIEEVYIWLCSQIGQPLESPWAVSAELTLQPEANLADVERPIEDLIAKELANIRSFTDRLCRGELAVC
jgi:S-adenosylmethionine synthetase